MSRTGKCTNFGKCVVAYRGEAISAPDDDFVCPECRHPLTPVAVNKKGGSKLMLILGVVGAAVLLLLIILVIAVLRLLSTEPEVPATPAVATGPAEQEPGEPPEAEPAPVAEPGEGRAAEVPAAASVPEKLNMNVQDEENSRVKAEVLKRIDLMPTISSEDKDKLYFSVERARQMGNIIRIPFAFGQRQLTEPDTAALREAFNSERVQKILEDPTAVLVVLGYADTKGDEQKNLQISIGRAEEVLKALRDKLGVRNVMHSVGMGGSTLFDAEGLEKNRVVEVWAVLP